MKLADSIRERIELIEADAGFRPVYWKAEIQLEDDSVLELRVESCPDGCGQVNMITSDGTG